jgi:hypothetical protein
MAIGYQRQLHAVDARAVVVMVLATVRRAFFPVRGIMISRAVGVAMTRRFRLMTTHVAAFHHRLRAAFPVRGQTTEETQLDQQAENDDAGVTHSNARGYYTC